MSVNAESATKSAEISRKAAEKKEGPTSRQETPNEEDLQAGEILVMEAEGKSGIYCPCPPGSNNDEVRKRTIYCPCPRP